jgi:hypothetical protein
MQKYLQRLAERMFRFRSYATREADDIHWKRDPLFHPALQKMTLNQLADLPFEPVCCETLRKGGDA